MSDDNEGFSPTESSVPGEPIETSCTDDPVCPYCGHVHQDSWEWDGAEGEHACDDCGEKFRWYSEVSRTWDTERFPTPTAK